MGCEAVRDFASVPGWEKDVWGGFLNEFCPFPAVLQPPGGVAVLCDCFVGF